jgi:hypothetical protein
VKTPLQGSLHFLIQNEHIGLLRSKPAENEPKMTNVSDLRLSLCETIVFRNDRIQLVFNLKTTYIKIWAQAAII